MRKVVVVSDSFKGSLTSAAIGDLVKEEAPRFFPGCQVEAIPVADGGEGTVACFLRCLGGEAVTLEVTGPLGGPVEAVYARQGDTAVIEMAAAAGLPLAGEARDPSRATTYGVGQLMAHAADRGCRRILLGLGGSATNDGGCGCAAALGAVFRDGAGEPFLPVGATLGRIASIDCSALRRRLAGVEVTAMCDVTNPLWGPEGAAHVFAPQKGADAAMVALLDEQLRRFGQALERALGTDVSRLPGAGAAGGMGAGCAALLGAALKPGIEAILDTVDFDRRLEGADLVITGEGRIDSQSLQGKVISGVVRRAKARGVPVIALVGDAADSAAGAYDLGLGAIFSINRLAIPFREAALRSAADYRATLRDVLRLIRIARGMGSL